MQRPILVGFLLSLLLATSALSVAPAMPEWNDDGIMMIKSNDGAFSFRFDVRVYVDFAHYFENKNDLASGADIRRARLGLKTRLHRHWKMEFDMDIADNEVEMKDMWMGREFGNALLKVGHFKPPFSLEELTSSRYITFLERALPNVFTPGRRIGLEIHSHEAFWQTSTAIYGQTATNPGKKGTDETIGFATRWTIAPLLPGGLRVHLGAGMYQQHPDDGGDVVSYDVRPETKVSRRKFMDTGDIDGVVTERVWNLEWATAWKSFSLQGEWINSSLIRSGDLYDYKFTGGYVYGTWLVTGEERPYSNNEGEFTQIRPSREWGAIELALRYSHLDLTDKSSAPHEWLLGGTANQYTIGMNWHFNTNIHLLMNYIRVDHSDSADGDGKYIGNDDFSFVTARFLFYF